MTIMIAAIEPFVVPYTETNDHDSTRYACLVKITGSDGTVGWGEAATIFAPAAQAAAVIIDGLAPALLGRSADPAEVRAGLEHDGWWYADAGVARFALSAIDLALWDLGGRAAGRPVADLLGRRVDSLPVVVCSHATDHDLKVMSRDLAATVGRFGAIGLKIAYGKRGAADLGVDHDRDVEFARLLRADLGPDALIMIDIAATLHWSLAEAVGRIRGFEEHGVYWTEEPLGADDPAGYAALRKQVHSLVAYGEREWSPAGYRRIIDSGTVDVVGIDPGRIGGIGAFREVDRMITRADLVGNAHAFAGPIILAAALALSVASDRFPRLEVAPTRNTLFDLCTGTPEVTEGGIRPTSAPGLGLEVSEDLVRSRALARHGSPHPQLDSARDRR